MTNESLVQTKPRLAPRVAFYLLMSFVTLYITLFSMGGSLFLLIDKWLPDVGDYAGAFDQAIRNFLSALIVAMPVFLLTDYLFVKSAKADTNIRKAGTWKWLTYITLFIAGIVILGNLIALVYSLLNGEITLRFMIKVFTIFVLAGGAFAYYFWDTRDSGHENDASNIPMIWHYSLLGLGLLVIIVGLINAGSPMRAKRERNDAMRLQNLQIMKNNVDSYTARHNNTLPMWLVDGSADFDYITFAKDPVTGQSFEYSAKTTSTYELCATFEAETNPNLTQPAYSPDYDAFWKHGVGRTCYTLTIRPMEKSTSVPIPTPVFVP